MEENKQDTLIRAYATLTSLRKNIGVMTAYNVPETYVREFHTVLDKLEAVGIDASEFRVPDSEIAPIDVSLPVVSFDSGNRLNPPRYSKENYVDKPFILTKLDAILGYFEILTSEKPRRMGFTKSNE